MLTNQTIKELKKEWTTWNKNIPSQLNHSNINEFRGYLVQYRQRLDMGLTLFNDEIKQLRYQANNKYNPETYNPRLADLYDEWQKEVAKVWWQFILSIGEITNSLFDYSPEKASDQQERIQRLKELHPDTDWDMYFLKNPLPTQDELNQQAMEKLLKRLKTDKARAERKWRAFAKKLKDFVVWADSWGVSDKIVVQTNQQIEETSINGVPFRFIGEPSKAYNGVDFLNDLHNTTIPLFVKRMREVMPLMQKMLIPFHVHFQKTDECGNNAAGCYEYTHIDITNWGITGNPRETIKILAHEMGHHIWKSFVKKEAQVFWSNALKGDLGEVDMEEVIQAWDRAGKRDSKLKVSDPIIYLQMEGLLFSPFYSNKGVVGVSHAIDLYREGSLERFIRVPTTPITGYAQKNSEEAFCEALGLLVAYGTRAVHEKIQALLQIILPNQIKTGSDMNNRIAGARVDLYKLIKEYNKLNGSTRNPNVPYIKEMYDLDLIEEEIRRFQGWVDEIKYLEPKLDREERKNVLRQRIKNNERRRNDDALEMQDIEDSLMGRRTRRASDVINELESRIARLEKNAEQSGSISIRHKKLPYESPHGVLKRYTEDFKQETANYGFGPHWDERYRFDGLSKKEERQLLKEVKSLPQVDEVSMFVRDDSEKGYRDIKASENRISRLERSASPKALVELGRRGRDHLNSQVFEWLGSYGDDRKQYVAVDVEDQVEFYGTYVKLNVELEYIDRANDREKSESAVFHLTVPARSIKQDRDGVYDEDSIFKAILHTDSADLDQY